MTWNIFIWNASLVGHFKKKTHDKKCQKTHETLVQTCIDSIVCIYLLFTLSTNIAHTIGLGGIQHKR